MNQNHQKTQEESSPWTPEQLSAGLTQGQQRARRLARLPESPDCWGRLLSFNDDSDSPSGKPGLISASLTQ